MINIDKRKLSANEFVEFCRKPCPRRKTCYYQGCILDE
jgi:hypothetical protein